MTENLHERIEALFAQVTPATMRRTAKALEELVRLVEDPATRRRYEAAIDLLPEIASGEQGGPDR